RRVQDAELTEIAHRQVSTVSRQRGNPAPVHFVTLQVLDALAGFEIPDTDLCERDILGTISQSCALDRYRALPGREKPVPVRHRRDEAHAGVHPRRVAVRIFDLPEALPVLEPPDGDRPTRAGPDDQSGSIGREGQTERPDRRWDRRS